MSTSTSQNVLDELRQDIREVKASLRELAIAMTTIALHNQRLDNLENRLSKAETSIDESWETMNRIQTTCQVRERVYHYGLRHMEERPVSREDWRDILIGGAVRHGVWIGLAALITALVTRYAVF
jgi:DNA repair ATPase RecN